MLDFFLYKVYLYTVTESAGVEGLDFHSKYKSSDSVLDLQALGKQLQKTAFLMQIPSAVRGMQF